MQRFVSYFVLSIEYVIHALQRKLDWVENEEGKKAEKFAKIVILKNMYTQQELDVRQRSEECQGEGCLISNRRRIPRCT